MRIAVLISGGGTNLAALIQAQQEGYFQSTIELVVSNNPKAYGLKRSEAAGIETLVTADETSLLDKINQKEIDLIVLAGYLKILSKDFIDAYRGKIINIHPSLLPMYGGKSSYGIHVHEAVMADKQPYTGATVHFVTEDIDMGEIILQESVAVDYGMILTATELQQEVLKIEHRVLKEAIRILESNQGDNL